MSVFDGFKPFTEKRRIDSTAIFSGESIQLSAYLASRFTYRTLEEWQQEIADGRFFVDNQHITNDVAIRCNAHLTYEFTEKNEPECDLNYKLLGITDDFICVSKSGNLPTHPAGRYYKNTLWYLLQKDFGPCAPVNRLDRETSGVLLFARTADAARFFSQCKMEKKYHVKVHGKFPEELDAEGFITQDKESVIRKKRKFFYTVPENIAFETCHTIFKRLNFSDEMSLVEAKLETGRTHQIRATCSSLGYPVAGDKIYGTDETIFLRFIEGTLTEDDKHKLLFDRQALHAYYLAFPSFRTGEKLEFTAEFELKHIK